MSESTPNSSRTLAILSGEAISVSALLSGCTLDRSVIGRCLKGWGRAPQRSANFWRQREQRNETLRQFHVSRYVDHVKRRAAMDHRRDVASRSAKFDCATLDRTAL